MRAFLRDLRDVPWLDRTAALAAFDRQSRRAWLGERAHEAVAVFFYFCLGLPISPVEVANCILFGTWILGMAVVWGTQRYIFLQPVVWLGLAWMAWQGLGLLWTPDVARGVEQFGAIRFLAAIVAVWPVIRRRSWFIAAAAGGFLVGNAAQAAVAIGVRYDIQWLVPSFEPRVAGRNGGWWPAVAGGEMLVAALALHLPAALMGRGRARVVAVLGAAATLAGILATGTRGAWIAAGLLTLIVAVVAIRRSASPGRTLAIIAAAGVALGAGVWFAAGDAISRRVTAAREEVRTAIHRADFNSDNGLRVLMVLWALDAVREYPLGGVGTGGFTAWMRERGDSIDLAAYERFVRQDHGHCHNALLQAAAANGVPGALLLGGLLGLAAWTGMARLRREDLGTYRAGPAFAVLGMLLLTPFDAFNLSAQTAAVLGAMIALSPAWRPGEGAESG